MSKEYQSLIVPRVEWNTKTLTTKYGEVTAQPLEPGLVLLWKCFPTYFVGGIEGAAVSSVIIKGINNEFSAIPGVVEDAMQVCLISNKLLLKVKMVNLVK